MRIGLRLLFITGFTSKKKIDLDTEKIEPVLDALQNALAICIKNENFMMAAGGSGWFLNCYQITWCLLQELNVKK